MIGGLFDRTGLLEKSLDAAMLRNEAIGQNIANIDTPNYKRKSVAFEEILTQEMDKSGIVGTTTNQRHIPIGGGDYNKVDIEIREDNSFNDMRLDGNNVDIDAEMALLAKNNIRYNMLIQRVSGAFSKIKTVLREVR